MLISPMGGNQQGMTLLVMQDHQSTTAQDFARASNQPAWDQRISVDRLAVTIDIKDRNRVLSPRVFLPQSSRPMCERFREGDICSTAGQLCQESLDVAVAVGSTPTGEQGKSLAGIAT